MRFVLWPVTMLVDANYNYGELLQGCVEQGIDVLCPAGPTHRGDDWTKRGTQGRFGKGQFTYEADHDRYRCPAGQELTFHGQRTDRDGRVYRHYHAVACVECALRARCTTATQGRSLARYPGDEYKEAMRWVLEQPRARAKYAERRTLGERVYAELTERQRLRRFHRRGHEGVAVEFALHCMAFDLKVALRHPAAAFLAVRVCVVMLYQHVGERWEAVGVASAAQTDWSAW